MTTLVKMLTGYASSQGWLNGGDIVGLDSVTAAALVADSVAVEYDAGSGSGTVVPPGFTRGQIASETDAEFLAAGGSEENLNPSAAIDGVQGDVTIVAGHARPNSEPWA